MTSFLSVQPTAPGSGQEPVDPVQKSPWTGWLAVILVVLMLGNTPLKQPVLVLYLLASLPFALRQHKALLNAIGRSPAMVAMWVLVVASLAWSAVPSASRPIVVSQTGLIALAVVIACRHREDGYGASLRQAALAFVGMTVLYCVAFPGAAYTSSGLKGFLTHKNHLGAMLALCTLVLVYAPGRNRWHLGVAALAAALVVLTQSKTAMALIVLCSLAWPMASLWSGRMYRQHAELLVTDVVRLTLHISALTALVMLVVFRDEALTLLWNLMPKTALTGRGTLWLVVIQHLRKDSLLGLGPGVFWQAEGASEIARTSIYLSDPHWVQRMVSSDGSYTDIVASFGVLGLAVFLWTAIDLYRELFRQWPLRDSKLLFVLTTFVLAHAVAETTLLYSPNVLWLIYLLCYFRVLARKTQHAARWGNR